MKTDLSDTHKAATRKVVRAKDIVAELTRDRQQTDEPVYTLRDAQISGKLDLKHRVVNVAVYILSCEFCDEVDLRYCEFTQTVNFARCHFHKCFNSGDELESHTVYRKDLICDETVFGEAGSFNGAQVEGSAHFSKASFQNEKHCIDFRNVIVGKDLKFDGATFSGGVSLNGATTKQFVIGESPNDHFPFRVGRVDIRSFTFEKFVGSKHQAVTLLKAQAPEAFSAFPYVQLEQYYRDLGDEDEARQMYYRARVDLRRNAKAPSGVTEWPYSRRMADWCLRWFIGYGVRPSRLLALFFAFIIMGTLVFWPDKSLVLVHETSAEAQSTGPDVYREPLSYPFGAKLTDRLLYSLDLFVPTANVLGLTVGDFGVSSVRAAPNGSLYQTYAICHQTAGYVFIALFLLIYTGALRRF